MQDLISRSALLKRIEEKRNQNPFYNSSTRDAIIWDDYFRDFASITIHAPAVDAEPVRHGRWIDMQEDDATEGMWRCSACGFDGYFDIMTPKECGTNYCPNCGAKMDAEVEG